MAPTRGATVEIGGLVVLARVGEIHENPVTGERGIVRVAPDESNGYLLVADLYARPGAAVAGEHVHPASAEAFTVVRGQLGMRLAGRKTVAGPGDRAQVPPGQPHDWWNAGDSEAHVIVEVQPGDRFVQMIRQLYGLARDGRTTAKGMPRLLDGVAMGREFSDAIRFTAPPQLVQRAMFALLGPLARLAGRRSSSPRYQHAPLPMTELELLPPEIVASIPVLAAHPEERSI